jgi:hypothetical protein
MDKITKYFSNKIELVTSLPKKIIKVLLKVIFTFISCVKRLTGFKVRNVEKYVLYKGANDNLCIDFFFTFAYDLS